MIELTPELASKMLDVWARRQNAPKGRVFTLTVLEEALVEHAPPPRYCRTGSGLQFRDPQRDPRTGRANGR